MPKQMGQACSDYTVGSDRRILPSNGADIKYPTDIDLLNQCREHLETAIDLLWPYVSHEQHKYPYNRKKARQSFLNISKSKKWTAKKLHTGIGQQLLYDFFENVWRSYRENRNII